MSRPSLPRGPPGISPLAHSFDDTSTSTNSSSTTSSYEATPRSTASASDLPWASHHQSYMPSPHQPNHYQHPPPSVPSTFLPSYYPESRNNDALPSHLAPNMDGYTRSHYASGGHLLDGVAMRSPPRQPRHISVPTYELSPGAAPRSLPPAPSERTNRPWNYNPSLELDLPGSLTHSIPSRSLSPRDGGGSHAMANRVATPHTSSPSRMPLLPPLSRSFSAGGPDVVPNSSGYGIMYDNVPLPDGVKNARWGAGGPERRVSGDDYAQVLAIYQHILSALPHMQPLMVSTSTNGAPVGDLVSLAIEAQAIISGQSSHGHTIDGPTLQTPFNESSSSSLDVRHGSTTVITGRNPPGGAGVADVKKGATKCLGCGATETPEWRRGPMGPRTLCNACGLVHMKLQRKKRKQEERAAAAVAAAATTINGTS